MGKNMGVTVSAGPVGVCPVISVGVGRTPHRELAPAGPLQAVVRARRMIAIRKRIDRGGGNAYVRGRPEDQFPALTWFSGILPSQDGIVTPFRVRVPSYSRPLPDDIHPSRLNGRVPSEAIHMP